MLRMTIVQRVLLTRRRQAAAVWHAFDSFHLRAKQNKHVLILYDSDVKACLVCTLLLQ